jgi:hypothetical protein
VFTPYALSLRVASAAEAYADDKAETIAAMNSNRIDNRERGGARPIVIAGALAANAPRVASIAVSPNRYLVGNFLLISVGAFCAIKIGLWACKNSKSLEDA